MNETKPLLLDAGLTRFVEKQMRNWEISRAQRREVQPTRQIEDFITIANMVGAGGREVAQAVAAELGWPMYDRDLLTSMARGDESRAGLYRSVDERELGWLEMTLRSVMEEAMRKNDYFHRLTTTVLGLARQRPAVFVGRGADLILPADRGLRVQLIASRDFCARRFAESAGLSLDEARARIDAIEAERRDFVRHHFHRDAHDPARFDLLVNVERISPDRAARIILSAHRDRTSSGLN
ncbi:MAG TPA: cytidylate kinase-like family protein [Phycisphaerae bacterium]|nr:cytidylate kinase-like family protein [Phycisphaerae bacterium]HOJ73719.1 cytidylate kinase-like family protein [Phycisphaerae bacterium]HOM50366.1 cytidylate kinase-like family protein [Phycisphaerae bacterium]HOQ84222.1 cytidylate kinase-like family protein [Phycisphaerae bacterium]HPP27275.1 cytidylate kinase-like family protein [Phycisphaerae bacterium]